VLSANDFTDDGIRKNQRSAVITVLTQPVVIDQGNGVGGAGTATAANGLINYFPVAGFEGTVRASPILFLRPLPGSRVPLRRLKTLPRPHRNRVVTVIMAWSQ
jgi:hypothetical protein